MRLHPFLVLAFVAAMSPPAEAQVSVIDDLGRTVRLSDHARRIVSLAPSLTETLFALGADDAVAGVTSYCTYPEAATRKPTVGGMINPSLEAIVACRPDLIVLSMEGNVREDFDRLTDLGAAVFVSNPRSFEGIRRSIEQLGTLTGRTDAASALSAELNAGEADIARTVSGLKPRTLMIVSTRPLVVVGSDTYLNELLETAGASNIAARYSSTYPTLSRETVVSEDPDLLLVTSDVVADTKRLLEEFPEWTSLTAIRRNRIYRVDADLVTRPGPRAVEALRLIAHLVHGGTP